MRGLKLPECQWKHRVMVAAFVRALPLVADGRLSSFELLAGFVRQSQQRLALGLSCGLRGC